MIVDANVVLAWLLDEPASAAAEPLLMRKDLAAPSLIAAEIGHVLTKRVRRRLLDPTGARVAWRTFAALPLRLEPMERLGERALDLSIELSAVYYDCVYLALAQLGDDALITSDESFVRAIRGSDAELATHVALLSELS